MPPEAPGCLRPTLGHLAACDHKRPGERQRRQIGTSWGLPPLTGGSLCCQMRRQLDAGGSATSAEPCWTLHQVAASSASSFLTASKTRGRELARHLTGLGDDRRPIPDAHPRTPGDRPVASTWHCRVRAEDPNRNDRHLRSDCHLCCARPELAYEPVAGTRTFGKDHDRPTLCQQGGKCARQHIAAPVMGNVLKTIADPLARHQLSKK